jgi:hypothetical protein
VRPKVIYVMGAGRSGSTILGIALGNCSDVFFAGELARWHRRRGAPLAGAERERFWQEVREKMGGDEHSLGREARFLQRSSAAFRITTWRAQRRLRGRYRESAQLLLETIAETAQATHVVDSSHFPRRARELQALGGIDLYVLFLVRDPQGIVAAYRRRDVRQGPEFGGLKTNAYLWLTYLWSLYVFLRHPRERRLLVRHEDFLADPRAVLGDILRCAGSDAEIPDLTALRTDTSFLGNRVASSPVVALRAAPERPRRGSPLTALLQLPWRAVFALLRPVAGRGDGPGEPARSEPSQ